jgi:hypothetical protein
LLAAVPDACPKYVPGIQSVCFDFGLYILT